MISITSSISISEDELQFSFIRSPGPGGQRVNKVETGVQLRFDAARSGAISKTVFRRLKELAGSRMTNDGVIILTVTTTRSQERNRAEARERLAALVAKACVRPKFRVPTKPGRGAKERRLTGKKQRSDVKKNRGKVGRGDD